LKNKIAWAVGVVLLIGMAVGAIMAVPTSSSPTNLPLPYPEMPASSYLNQITSGGFLPANVAAATFIPASSKLIGVENFDQGAGAFDRGLILEVSIPPAKLNSFFVPALGNRGWKILTNTTSHSGSNLIARIAGSDGNFWEIGIKNPPPSSYQTVSPPTPAGLLIEVRILQNQPQ
jgi:hypothetical protein